MTKSALAQSISIALILAAAKERANEAPGGTVAKSLTAMGIDMPEQALLDAGGTIAAEVLEAIERGQNHLADMLFKFYIEGKFVKDEIKFAATCFPNSTALKLLLDTVLTIDGWIKNTPPKEPMYQEASPAPLPTSIGDPKFREKLFGDLSAALEKMPSGDVLWEGYAAALIKAGNLIRTGKLPATIAPAFLQGILNDYISPFHDADVAWAFETSKLAQPGLGISIVRTPNGLLAEPAFWLRRGSNVNSRSQIGGVPTLPAELDWPAQLNTGLPLHFLAQIDLARLPAKTKLPRTGMLFFFADLDEEMLWGEEEGGAIASSRVLYAASAGDQKPLPENLPKIGHEYGAPAGYYSAEFSHYPSIAVETQSQVISPRHQILGVGANIQGAAQRARDSGFSLLLQLDSDRSIHERFVFCDMGMIQFWIKPEDLDAGLFERAWATTEGG
jgi:uncharacterized protein YwqG